MGGTILVGVDRLRPSRIALEWSLARAAATGSAVHMVHVVDDDDVLATAYRRGAAERMLGHEVDWARANGSGVEVTSELRTGSPMWELASAAAEADLVVVGTHKTGFVHGKVFGSRSLQLAAISSTPVAIIPESSSRTRRGIVVGVDDSSAAAAALRFAAAEADRTGQLLAIVRAWGESERHGVYVEPPSEQHRSEEDRMEAGARAMVLQAELTVREPVDMRPRTPRKPPAESLVAASATAELLVLGNSRGRHGDGMSLGSVSHDVLINIAGPTVVVHGEP